jgi:hypothetical protein
MKVKINLTSIRSCDTVRMSPLRYHRAKAPYDVFLLICGTSRRLRDVYSLKLKLSKQNN